MNVSSEKTAKLWKTCLIRVFNFVIIYMVLQTKSLHQLSGRIPVQGRAGYHPGSLKQIYSLDVSRGHPDEKSPLLAGRTGTETSLVRRSPSGDPKPRPQGRSTALPTRQRGDPTLGFCVTLD